MTTESPHVCPNGHPFPSPVPVPCACGAKVACVPIAEPYEAAWRVLAVRDRIALLNTDTDRPSARKDGPDLAWACAELQAIADALAHAR